MVRIFINLGYLNLILRNFLKTTAL